MARSISEITTPEERQLWDRISLLEALQTLYITRHHAHLKRAVHRLLQTTLRDSPKKTLLHSWKDLHTTQKVAEIGSRSSLRRPR